MFRMTIFLLVEFVVFCSPLRTFYLLDIDHRSSFNTSFCSDSLIDGEFYRIPRQCQKHLQCHSFHCDEQSFRCVKIRETLCCLKRYFHRHCSKSERQQIKDQFRSVYFHVSIEHGYCEINLERIEKLDENYCLADPPESFDRSISTTTMKIERHRTRHRLASRTNRSLIIEHFSSKSSSIFSIPLICQMFILFPHFFVLFR